jgi:hypothetical protein
MAEQTLVPTLQLTLALPVWMVPTEQGFIGSDELFLGQTLDEKLHPFQAAPKQRLPRNRWSVKDIHHLALPPGSGLCLHVPFLGDYGLFNEGGQLKIRTPLWAILPVATAPGICCLSALSWVHSGHPSFPAMEVLIQARPGLHFTLPLLGKVEAEVRVG